MNLIFWKKEKKISISDLHQEVMNPEKHWFMILGFSFLIILLGIIISSSFFISIINKDKSEITTEDTSESLDLNKLQSAVDFIKSR